MTSATLSGWTPRTPTNYARPVQVEDATSGLSGAKMPDGRAILVWPGGGDAHFAVVANPQAWLTDDIVEAGDIGTIVTGSVTRTAVYNIDDQIYVTVDSWQGSGGVWTLDIYSADDPTDPYAGWTLEANVESANSPGSIFGYTSWGAGIPLKLDSGRWVLCQGGGETGAMPGWAASGTFAHAWYSDNGAAGPWNHVLEYGHYLSGFPRTGWVSAQVAADPAASGDLYFTSGAISTNEALLWRSTDDGASWTSYPASTGWGGAHQMLSPVIDNGSTVYAMDTTDFLTPTGDPTDLNVGTGGWSGSIDWPAPGMSTDENTRKAIISAPSVFVFVLDQVAKLSGGWHTGYVGN